MENKPFEGSTWIPKISVDRKTHIIFLFYFSFKKYPCIRATDIRTLV